MKGRCNRCTLESMQTMAVSRDARLIITLKRAGVAMKSDDPAFASLNNREGYEVFVLYQGMPDPVWAGWFSDLPTTCDCPGIP